MIENIKACELKVGDVIHYNTRDCVRSTGAKQGMPFFAQVKRITPASQSTVKVKTSVGDELILLPETVVQIEIEEKDYTPEPRTRAKTFRGVSIE